MRILWASNAPWAPTGYGTQTALFCRRLRDAGHEVAVASNFGLQGAVIDWEGIPVFPAGTDAYSNDILPAQYLAWMSGKPGWLITLYDVWVFREAYFAKIPTACWTPVDHYPAPPGVIEWAKGHRTIAMSRYGQEALKKKGVDAAYVPHAIDRSIFAPVAREDARKELGMPQGDYLVMVNAANKGAYPPRKAWSENFGALAIFMSQHPDVHVYVHTDVFGVNGIDLQRLARFWGLPPERTHFAPQYEYKLGAIKQETLARYYSAADVLLATSMGEGFGIPTIEAQACGTPVIVSNFAASPELVGAGWIADVQPWYDGLQDAGFGMPLISSIVEQLEHSYAARGSAELREQAIAKAAEYDADLVWERDWAPVIAGLEMAMRPAVVPDRPNRAQRRKKRAA